MESIEIKGFKSIKDLKIKLEPINILIGANGSGKTNFISFFEFLDRLYNKKLQEYVGLKGADISKFIHKGVENSDLIEAKIVFNKGKNSYSFELKPSGNSFVISKEVLWFYDNPLVYEKFTKEAEVKNNDWHRGKYIQRYLVGHKKYHFHDTGQNSPFNRTSKIGKDSQFLYERGENVAAILFRIKDENYKIYSRIVKNIQSIAPYFSDFVLNPDKDGNIKLYWQDKYSSYNYDVTDLSDGTIRFIALAILFMQPQLPKTIVLDEPELGLHPKAIAKLAGLIQSVSEKESQVIIATQSAELISYFKPEDIIAVDQINGCSVFNRLKTEDLEDWLEDYTIGNLWQRNIINKAQPF